MMSVTQTELVFDTTAVPEYTRNYARTIAKALAETGVVFSFIPVEGGYPSVQERLSDTARMTIGKHPSFWGTLPHMMQRAGEIVEAGRAKAIEPNPKKRTKRRKVNLWRGK